MALPEKRTIAFVSIVLFVYLITNYFNWSPLRCSEKAYSLSESIGVWQGREVSFERERLTEWLGTKNIVFREYRNTKTGDVIVLYVAYYKNMEASDLAHAPEVCYPGQGWSIKFNKDIEVTSLNRKNKVKRIIIEKDTRKEVVYSWWQVGDTLIASNSWYRLNQIYRRLCSLNTASIWVRISVETAGKDKDRIPEETVLVDFMNDAAPALKNYF